MRTRTRLWAASCTMAVLGCAEPDETQEIIDNLIQAGFPSDDIMTRDGIVYVGRDAEVSLAASREMLEPAGDHEEQYRTNNTIDTSLTKICINGATFTGNFSTALDLAVQNYDEQALNFAMARTPSTGCSFTINAVIQPGLVGGSSGFPSGGRPFATIKIGGGLSGYSVDTIENVITHEIGHTIGFRHSDYFNRSISCGSGGNEGDDGVGAILIPGTPSGASVGASLMNSCFRMVETGEFTATDVTALLALYAGFGGHEIWTTEPYFGTRGTFFADIDNDAKADAIVVNNNEVTVRRSNGSGFGAYENWTSGPYFGTRGTFFADVDGDHRADAIAVNDNGTFVRRSTGSSFGAAQTWTVEPYFGSRGTFFADVDNDGRADAIVVNDTQVTVRRSTGNGFGAYENWTAQPYFGALGTFFADVNDDGKADAIVVNAGGVTVRRSTGSSFGDYENWTVEPYFGTRGTFFADLDGDRRADAIVVNDNAVIARRSTGSGFGAYENWSTEAYFGDIGTFFADVTGDQRADALAVNSYGVTARRSMR